MNAALEWAAGLDTRWMLALLLVALNLWATWLIAFSGAPGREKILWVTVIFLCPIVGPVLWFVLGPKRSMLES
ncbi:PLDc N-terminal domain-containing protein [Candidatus Palauibacter sp.]|uniref:PLDc N-terminal domain-containing protein n=1 Tax=Candidatus Palauibacter sp. TaxID=3101350 RepID=UPI003C700339